MNGVNMNRVLPADAWSVYEDFRTRTLSRVPSHLERLIYIASTREYNSGLYQHEGLARRYGTKAAALALEYAHREAFQIISVLSLRRLTEELSRYINAS